ncbi:MAG: histidinol-phosphate transaminase [Bacteroidetes bacterium]|nr:histidinol-phosphate transaminase [Bacteroidota bacterium]
MNSFNINKYVRSNILNASPYSSARDEFTDLDRDMVFLDANENPFENGVNRYPDPNQQSITALLAMQKGVDTSQILLGNGSDEVLDLLFRAFCEPNKDNVISLPPTYGMYKVLSAINAVAYREILLDRTFQPRIPEILAAQDEYSKLLFLCSPNNPTGNSIDQEIIMKLLRDFNGIVVIDEAYIDFSEKESWITQLNKYPNLVVTQTLSKAYGMAGIRLGICFASDAIISILKKIKPPYNVNSLTQQRALEGLLNVESVINEVSIIVKEKERLCNLMSELTCIQKIFPSDANFLLAQVDDAPKRYHQLIEKGIVVRNRSSQPLCANTLRFTVGTPSENDQLINALKQIE